MIHLKDGMLHLPAKVQTSNFSNQRNYSIATLVPEL
jgi:hypothetical protein